MGATTTSPVNADTDDGGVSDGEEDASKNGRVDVGERDPNVTCDDAGLEACNPPMMVPDAGMPTAPAATSNLRSLAGGGGCSVSPARHQTGHGTTFAWLMPLLAAWLVRRRTRRPS